MSELRARTVTGLKWSGVSQVARQLLQFSISVYLARTLSPQEFGLMGMVLVFSGVAALFSDLGLGAALIQRKQLDDRHLSSIFWVNAATGAALAALFAAGAPLLAAFYGEPVLRALTAAVGLNFLVGSLGVVQRSVLVRALDFRRLFFVDLAATACSGAAAVAAARSGLGVWSLVAQSLTSSATAVALLWAFSSWRPRGRIDRSALGDVFGYSANLLGFNLLNYSNRHLDNMLIGKFFGAAPLGVYTRAYDLMLLPISQVTSVLTSVMFPALSSIQHDKAQVKRVYMRATRAISLLTFPMMTGLLLTAEPFVLAVYGDKWREVVPIIRIFCLIGMADSITTTVGWIFNSQGRTDVQLRWGLYDFVMTTLFFVISLPWGVKGIAWGYAACGYVQLVPCWTVAGRLIDLRFVEMARNVSGPFFCALGMGAAVWLLGSSLPGHWSHWALLGIQVPAGAAAYLALVHAFDVRAYVEVRDLLKERLA